MLIVVLFCYFSYPEGFGCEMHKKPSRKIWRHLFSDKNNRMMAPTDIPDSAKGELDFFLMYKSLCISFGFF